MVGDGHEVQRHAQAHDASVRPGNPFAAPVSVGHGGIVAVGSHDVRIKRPAGMDVEIAKVGVARRIRLSRLRLPGGCRRSWRSWGEKLGACLRRQGNEDPKQRPWPEYATAHEL